jgi:hypothetical protein
MRAAAAAAVLLAACLAAPAAASPEALALLRRAGVLSPHRTVDSAREVCTLSVDGRPYRVIDLVEHVRGAQSDRGVRRAILIGPARTKVNELPYFPPAAPVSCDGNVLTFSAPVEVDNTEPEGRSVAFEHGGADARVIDAP